MLPILIQGFQFNVSIIEENPSRCQIDRILSIYVRLKITPLRKISWESPRGFLPLGMENEKEILHRHTTRPGSWKKIW